MWSILLRPLLALLRFSRPVSTSFSEGSVLALDAYWKSWGAPNFFIGTSFYYMVHQGLALLIMLGHVLNVYSYILVTHYLPYYLHSLSAMLGKILPSLLVLF